MSSSVIYNTLLEEDFNIFPTSLTQQRLWFFDRLEPSSAVYNINSHLRLRVPLDKEVFKQSLDAIMRRQEGLRTAIVAIEGQPMQLVSPSLTLPLPMIDLQHLPENELEAEILRLATEEAQKPFDLSQAPLIRTILLRLGREDYLLLLSMHRIISDEWSIGLFCQELAVLYEAFLNGQPSPLAPLPIQYTDYTHWQEEWLQGDRLADQLIYWKKQLENIPAVLTLPSDRLRPPTRTYHGGAQPFTLSKCLTDKLNALSHQEGVSLYTTLVAAFQTLLFRYSGQDDMSIGLPVVGRNQPEAEKLIGPLSNTILLRTDLSGNPTFHELLKRVQKVLLDAQSHQDIPFEYLAKELHLEQSEVQDSLFQVMLILEPQAPLLPSRWTLTQLKVETGTSRFDLTLYLEELTEGIIGRFEYSTDLFDAATIYRMVGHWQTSLEGIVADPTQHIGMLPLLTQAERNQQLVEWNPTDVEYPKDKCIHQLFEAQVERTPDAVAVVFEDKCLTYRELNRKANQLAHYLQRLGVGPEVLVGIYVERSLEMVVGLLAILKAGGAYVPLDRTYPIERLAFMLADTQAPVVCTQQQFVTTLPKYEGHVVCLDTDEAKIAQESEENLDSVVTGDCLAYVIYTSGSTGKPKGVLINHVSAVHLFEATRALFHFDHHDVWSLFHSYAFDFSVWELWNPLVSGGRVVVVPYEVSRSSEAFYSLLHTERVTILNQCPSAFHQLIRMEETSNTTQSLALRVVIFGCEAFEVQSLKPWFDRQGDQAPQLVVMYGPTETTVFDTYYPLSAIDLERASGSTIGRPIPGSQIYILDSYLQPVPIGVSGEIFIGGTGLARGYLNRPELTAERFVPNPFNQTPDARLYKTGDLARYLPNGNVEFLGRVDDQVKIRGFRVELGEIDAVLIQYPAVVQEVVVVREDTPGDKRLVAYIVAAQGQTLSIKNLRSYLAERLPAYMVPSAFVLLDALPLTHNSKIDKRSLPMPQQTERTAEETYVPATLMVHYQLIQIWEELLDTRPIGISDNFFNLGGHSFLAARMVSQFEQVSGKKIPLATLFAGPTIEQLANALQTEQKEEYSRTPIVAVQSGSSKRPLFYLHGDWTGGAFYCFHLARELGAEQPFYALAPYRFDDLPLPPTIEMMAAAHIESIRAVQPEGPYQLAGWCNGGLVVYEIAQQLQAAGQRVDLLALVDPMYLGYYSPRKLLRVAVSHFGNLIGLSPERQLNWFLRLLHVSDPLLNVYCRLKNVHHKSSHDSIRLIINDTIIFAWQKVTSIIKNSVSIAEHEQASQSRPDLHALKVQAQAHQNYSYILEWIAMGYTPSSPYPGKITFFWPSTAPWHVVSGGWLNVAEAKEAQDIEAYVIPGHQGTWRHEHLHALAERLKACLNDVQLIGAEQ